ncbi:Uncharacterized protein dnl_23180 [Desulfonema limicola]|uniref:Uncharacterized protein n=1 Tax=Desulfonema limicola TaxID=45656 RepID=A0A975B717_9BACT|nr:Uncharacterized protein dnl_23180 [Desulfonema limicola]
MLIVYKIFRFKSLYHKFYNSAQKIINSLPAAETRHALSLQVGMKL